MTTTVDQYARDTASKATDAIKAHETLCGERWSAARGEMKNVRTTLWWLITVLVAGQGAIIMFLLQRPA